MTYRVETLELTTDIGTEKLRRLHVTLLCHTSKANKKPKKVDNASSTVPKLDMLLGGSSKDASHVLWQGCRSGSELHTFNVPL